MFKSLDPYLSATTRAIMLSSALVFISTTTGCSREEIGSVNTNFRITGSDKVVIEAYDDPKVAGVTCYVSRAKTGGVSSWFGMAEDAAEAAIACRQTGEIKFNGTLPQQETIFTERMSVMFKTLHVVRSIDGKRNTLVYMTYTDKILSGSPKSSVTAVPMPAGVTIPAQK
jgi:CreA protein